MKRPQFPTPSYSAQVARKSRYSSTGVGFPIRNDQKADCQRVSKGFPTWERARHAGAYVREPRLCVCRAYNSQPYPKAMTTTLLMYYTTPLTMLQTTTMPMTTTLLMDCTTPLTMLQTTTMARPHIHIAMSQGESESERTSHSKTNWSSLAVHLGVTCSHDRRIMNASCVLSVNLLSLFVVHS